jgi:hypothetical protein
MQPSPIAEVNGPMRPSWRRLTAAVRWRGSLAGARAQRPGSSRCGAGRPPLMVL